MNAERIGQQKEIKEVPKTSLMARFAVLNHNLATREGMGSSRISRAIQNGLFWIEDQVNNSHILSEEAHAQYMNTLYEDLLRHNPDKIISCFLLREAKAENDFVSKKDGGLSLKKGKRFIRLYPFNHSDKGTTFETLVSGMKKVAKYIEINEKKLPKQNCITFITYTISHARLFGRLGFTVEETPYVEGKNRFFGKTLSPISQEVKSMHSSIFVCSQTYDEIKGRFSDSSQPKTTS